jgi:fucose 4-O-acetylase-like acetyltransferase
MIDVAKGLSILLVVLGHNSIFGAHQPAIASALSAFRVPFFFFIAGVVFSPQHKTLRQILLRNADAWLKPALVVTVGMGLVGIITGKVALESILLAVTYATGFTLFWPALWFLPHLWLVCGFSAGLLIHGKRLVDNGFKKTVLLVVLAALGFLAINLFDEPIANHACYRQTSFSPMLAECGLPFSADLLFVTSFFFLGGHFLNSLVKRFRCTPAMLGLALLALGLLIGLPALPTDLNFRIYSNVLTSPLRAVAGIFLMLCLCDVLARAAWVTGFFSAVGQRSLFILIFHLPVVFLLVRNLPRFIDSPLLVGAAAYVVPLAWSAFLYEVVMRSRFLRTVMLPVKSNSPRTAPEAVQPTSSH